VPTLLNNGSCAQVHDPDRWSLRGVWLQLWREP
jgi:hypothetical protein